MIEPTVFNLYEDLLPPSDFIDDSEVLAKAQGMVIFGDSFGSYWVAMHQDNGQVFVLDPPFVDPQGSFESFILEKLEIGASSMADLGA